MNELGKIDWLSAVLAFYRPPPPLPKTSSAELYLHDAVQQRHLHNAHLLPKFVDLRLLAIPELESQIESIEDQELELSFLASNKSPEDLGQISDHAIDLTSEDCWSIIDAVEKTKILGDRLWIVFVPVGTPSIASIQAMYSEYYSFTDMLGRCYLFLDPSFEQIRDVIKKLPDKELKLNTQQEQIVKDFLEKNPVYERVVWNEDWDEVFVYHKGSIKPYAVSDFPKDSAEKELVWELESALSNAS